jgi:cysteine desulfurase
MPSLYLDYNASSPLRAEAFEAMRPWLCDEYGNPSSTHQAGQRARAALEDARERMARLLGAKASEIIFTSGGSEAINLALRGSPAAHFRLQSAKTEHHAVLNAAHAVSGAHLEMLEVDAKGQLRIHPPKGGMVSLMHANNETGLLHPVEELAKLAHLHGALFHCDAVQSFGKLPIDLKSFEADFLSASAHKFGGPKGAGFLFARQGTPLNSQISGGEQESGHRAGTENVAAIVGMAKAAELACAEMESEGRRLEGLRDHLQAALMETVEGLRVNCSGAPRIFNTLSLLLPGIESDMMIMRLDQEGILVSAGSACAAGAVEASHVLKAMGIPENEAKCVLRLSLGRETQGADIEHVVASIARAVTDFKKAGV